MLHYTAQGYLEDEVTRRSATEDVRLFFAWIFVRVLAYLNQIMLRQIGKRSEASYLNNSCGCHAFSEEVALRMNNPLMYSAPSHGSYTF